MEEQQLKPTAEQQTTQTAQDALTASADEPTAPAPEAATAIPAEEPVLSHEIVQTPLPEELLVQPTKDELEAATEDKPVVLPDTSVREAQEEMISPAEKPTAPAPELLESAPAVEYAASEQDNQLQAEQDRHLKSAIESLLFIAGNPLSLDRLKGIFEDATREQIVTQIDALQQEYEERGSGIMLAEVAGGFQLGTRPENAAWIRKFRSVKISSKLSRPALETLAIVAYKQPITRTEVEAVRGVNIGGIMRNLMERRLVKIVGKKDVPGKPMMYGTSLEFLQYFGLKDLSALPTLKEFQELEAGEEVMQDAALNDADATTAEDEAFIEAAAAEAAKEENVIK